MLDENYPFSKYSMYSNPSSRPLRYHYLVDAAGDPIPTKFHTRLTPSKITKTLRRTKSQVREEMGILEDKAEADALSRVESLAAEKVVARLWRESQKLPRNLGPSLILGPTLCDLCSGGGEENEGEAEPAAAASQRKPKGA